MILSLTVPRVGEQMRRGTVHRVLARPGDALRPGSPLLELRVDLGAPKAQDCPPMFYLRLMATERAHLRTLAAVAGDVLEVGAAIGVATTTPGESPEGAARRALRTTAVAIATDPLSG